MKKRYLPVILGLILLGSAGPSRAEWVRCARYFISGFLDEHDKGVSLLGNDTTPDPQKMSVYIAPVSYQYKRALYVQSNYKTPQDTYPIKIAVNDDVDLRTVLSWIPFAGRQTPFDSRGVTFYVEPAFFSDPVYGKYKDQADGKVVVLPETENTAAPLGTMKPIVPQSWVVVQKGVIQNSKTPLPPAFIQMSNEARTKLVAVGPGSSESGYAFMVFQENPGMAGGLPVTDEMLTRLSKARESGNPSDVIETKIFAAFGKKILRAVEDREGSGNGPPTRRVTYIYQNGQDINLIRCSAGKDVFNQFAQIFQDALKQTIVASQP